MYKYKIHILSVQYFRTYCVSIFFQFQAVFRIWQSRHREPGNIVLRHFVPIKNLSFSTFRRIPITRCVLSSEIPRFDLLQERENENRICHCLEWESNSQSVAFTIASLWPRTVPDQPQSNIQNNSKYFHIKIWSCNPKLYTMKIQRQPVTIK